MASYFNSFHIFNASRDVSLSSDGTELFIKERIIQNVISTEPRSSKKSGSQTVFTGDLMVRKDSHCGSRCKSRIYGIHDILEDFFYFNSKTNEPIGKL